MARIKITERRLSVEDTLSRRATREVTQGINLAHFIFLIPPLVVRTSLGRMEGRTAAPRSFHVSFARFHEQSVYTRASESLIAMQLELSYWKDKPCLSLSPSPLRGVEQTKTSKRIPIARERVLCTTPLPNPRFFKRLDNTNFCNLGGIAAWQFRMNPLSGRLRARVDLRGKFYKADPPLLPPSPVLQHGSNRIDAGLDRLYVLHIPNNAHIYKFRIYAAVSTRG